MSRSSQALPGSLSSLGPMIDKPEARRFPPPWIAEETDACFIIRDHSGYALAYVYFEEELGPSRIVRDEPGCRNEKLKKRLYCVARTDRKAGKSPVMLSF